MRVRTFVLISLSLLCCAAAAPSTHSATAPASSTRPASTSQPSRRQIEEGRKALRAAIAELTREYERSLREPGVELRTASTYFKDHPDETITQDLIISSLLAQGGDLRASAYVKWQLLSALGDEIDEAAAKQLVDAYCSAPKPIVRPGIERQDQQKLDRLTQSARAGDEPGLIETIDRAVEATRKANMPILAYRGELYRRLPKESQTFAAALEDLHERHLAAAEGKELAKALVADVREWAATASPAPQALLALARACRRLADTPGPQYYTTPYFNQRSSVFTWRKSRAAVDSARALKDLAVALEEQSRQPPLDLEIK